MLSLPGSVKTMINEKKLSMGHARALINVENAESIAEKIIEKLAISFPFCIVLISGSIPILPINMTLFIVPLDIIML